MARIERNLSTPEGRAFWAEDSPRLGVNALAERRLTQLRAAKAILGSVRYSAFCFQWIVVAVCAVFGDPRKVEEWYR